MKKIYHILLIMLAMSFVLIACTEETPFSTATENDDPRILDPLFPDRVNGELPVVSNISRDANFSMTLTVTPADYTTVTWFIDGEEIQTGKEIDLALKAGTYHLKVTATTSIGKSTYREGLIQVNPLADDPWATEIGFERIITTGAKAQLYGNNLDKVNSIVIGGKTATDIAYTENGENSYIEYTVPEGLADGTYRIILVDNGGNEYGGNKVTVTSDALITAGSERTTANSEWVMTGINLNQIESFTFGGQTVSSFIRQSETEIAFTCPSLEDGEYTLTGRTTSGKEVMFYTTTGNITEQTVVVSSERVLWEGHHYVSWDLPDDNPNKTFNLIGKDVFASIKAGAVLSIYYSVNSADEYHQLRTTTGWWNDLPGTAVIEFQEDGVKQVQLTQEVLDKIQTEDGFLCIGHGYYVDRISVQ
ncbi:hypothetical protein [Phocaeicola coprocola]|uniref:hypothetical protein n=1 Tax=Phocaeicola coprocola TaxID=310298 RepID=UPI001C37FCF2|nr:hypothetical protein [Phocaeicola coprocola]MBV3866976.1 hypothetical protein [Phocaeicola coprocola]MBV4008154.1 hypothetical protein [Phocaeicola coprocola]MBV4032655.1 hypothetical protein [Phocaeicola coprocola]MBV4039208.1 hypothetical protein [Phocaeicola coprocola]MBV4060840.1 hypothetical protein [Phocaeicola coprocola]